MRIKVRFFVILLTSAFSYSDFARGQDRENIFGSAKNDRSVPKAAHLIAQVAKDPAKKPGEAPKKPADDPKPSVAKPNQPESAESVDEKGVRAAAASFVKLYNAHEAKGLTALFAPTAEMIDEDGVITKGRDAIEQQFVKAFAETPKTSMRVDIDSVRIVAPGVAIEEGVALSKDSPDEADAASAYVAVHVKTDGKWMLVSVRDSGAPPKEITPHEHLEQLAWLVGDWIEESAESVVRSSCNWHDNGNFLMQEFSVQIGGEIAMSGTMRIGWDAVRKQLRSWVFDSHGGYVEGYWIFDGDEWIVKSQGATAAGEAASATTVYRPMNDDTLMWSSTDRVIDGVLKENVEPIIVKKRPPEPSK